MTLTIERKTKMTQTGKTGEYGKGLSKFERRRMTIDGCEPLFGNVCTLFWGRKTDPFKIAGKFRILLRVERGWCTALMTAEFLRDKSVQVHGPGAARWRGAVWCTVTGRRAIYAGVWHCSIQTWKAKKNSFDFSEKRTAYWVEKGREHQSINRMTTQSIQE